MTASLNEIDDAYYRISKSWRSLSRQDKRLALINLGRWRHKPTSWAAPESRWPRAFVLFEE